MAQAVLISDEEVSALQAAVEHLRSVTPDEDDMDGRARRADAAFRIAYKLEQLAKRAQPIHACYTTD